MEIKRTFSFFPVLFAAALLPAVCALFSGCYTIKQGTAMLGYLGRAVPLESLLESEKGAEPAETDKDRLFVQRVQDIRRFATGELGLSLGKNYTRYVSIDRDYLAAVVSASAADSFTPHEWRYPVVGVMPYKGFFNVEDARKERAKLEKKGLDVWVRGVDAFSTLGWFRDPLYSYMRDYPVDRLADLIIHESVHATVFIKGQAQFNEELAEFVGSEGARLYMESRFGVDSEEYRAMLASGEDNRRFVAFIREVIAELEAVYGSAADSGEKLLEKERVINAAKERFAAEYDDRFTSANYRGFSDLLVNNAYLELFRLYHAEDDFFAELYERSGKDLPAFIAAAKTLSKKRPRTDPRKRFAEALELSS
jgi:predicted aminopeptidase